MRNVMKGLVVVCFALAMFGCANGTNPIPQSATCQLPICADSQICKAFGNENAPFGTVEFGIAFAVIEDPGAKPAIIKAYQGMKAAFSDPTTTYAQLGEIVAAQFSGEMGKYAPLVSVLIIRFGSFTSTVPLNECDRGFLVQHCNNVLKSLGAA